MEEVWLVVALPLRPAEVAAEWDDEYWCLSKVFVKRGRYEYEG
jgi:hypothetical protein